MNKEAEQRETKASKKSTVSKLEEVLMPFAEWAWGDKDTAKKVVDKYFKQVINK